MRILPPLFSVLLLLPRFRSVWSQSSNSTNGGGGNTDLQLCRCQASWEKLYGGQGRRRGRRLSALYPGVNYNNVEKRGRYFVIDNLIVLPNKDPKCSRNGGGGNNGGGKGKGNGSLFFRGIRIGHRALGGQESIAEDSAPLQQQHLQSMMSARSRGATPPREIVESSESLSQSQLRQESTATSSLSAAHRGLQQGPPKVFPCPANLNPNPAPRPTKKPSTRSPASAPAATTVEPTVNPTAGSSSETNEPTIPPTSTAVPTSSTQFPTPSTDVPTGAAPTPAPTAGTDDQNLDDVLNTPTADPTFTAGPTPTDGVTPVPTPPSTSTTLEPTATPSSIATAPPTATDAGPVDDAVGTSGPTFSPTVAPTTAGAVTKFAAAEGLSAARDGNHAKSAEKEKPMSFLEALGSFKEIRDGEGN